MRLMRGHCNVLIGLVLHYLVRTDRFCLLYCIYIHGLLVVVLWKVLEISRGTKKTSSIVYFIFMFQKAFRFVYYRLLLFCTRVPGLLTGNIHRQRGERAGFNNLEELLNSPLCCRGRGAVVSIDQCIKVIQINWFTFIRQ